MAADVTLVIPVWNQLEYTRKCLESLAAKTPAGSYDLVVVDNGSTDGTGEWLKGAAREGTTVLTNEKNLGCAPAWNQGVKAARGRFIAIANNDLVFTSGWLSGLMTAMEKHGLAMGEPACREGELDYDLEAFARNFTGRNAGRTSPDVVGYCMAFRREVFDRVGLFDEAFVLGKGEDEDLRRRMKEAGLTYAQVGDSFVHHFGSVSIRELEARAPGFEERNVETFRRKWGEAPGGKPGLAERLRRSWAKWKRRFGRL